MAGTTLERLLGVAADKAVAAAADTWSEDAAAPADEGGTAETAAERAASGGCRLKKLQGSWESWRQLTEFLSTDADREIEAFFSPFREPHMVRTLVIRHGMGDHNAYGGVASILNEDAGLNEVGRAQAELVGDLLRTRGVTAAFGLAVVSPFSRALQTGLHLLDVHIGATLHPSRAARAGQLGYAVSGPPAPAERLVETMVQPLCAEETFLHSHVWRGNRGSTATELAKNADFDIFDFSPLARYCKERRTGAKNPEHGDKWWHHGPHGQETEGSFKRRMVRLRKWLGALAWHRPGPLRAILICHGGVMQEAFGYRPNAPNCGFRVFDVLSDGRALRPGAGERAAEAEEGDLADPAFRVCAVVQRQEREHGHFSYDIELGVGAETFWAAWRESELREQVREVVKHGLPAADYERYSLRGKFPRYALTGRGMSADPAINIQDYLEQLAIAMGDDGFDKEVFSTIDGSLLGNRIWQLRNSFAVEPEPTRSEGSRCRLM